jgi:hypothetical protein
LSVSPLLPPTRYPIALSPTPEEIAQVLGKLASLPAGVRVHDERRSVGYPLSTALSPTPGQIAQVLGELASLWAGVRVHDERRW